MERVPGVDRSLRERRVFCSRSEQSTTNRLEIGRATMAEKHTAPELHLDDHEVEATAVPVSVPVETVPLNVVLASVLRDSRKQPEAYLDQVHVPHGGE
jgi:hypothetical protein